MKLPFFGLLVANKISSTVLDKSKNHALPLSFRRVFPCWIPTDHSSSFSEIAVAAHNKQKRY
eukprot:maker-scaffold_32-snap-gene-0.3-mRNA-1 protein AED:0.03 eAED:0.03 QI:0/0.5/0.33/1/0/0/3/1100/61